MSRNSRLTDQWHQGKEQPNHDKQYTWTQRKAKQPALSFPALWGRRSCLLYSCLLHVCSLEPGVIIGIKHLFSCINIRQVPWKVLKTEAECRGFQHLPRNLANVNALKKHVRSLLLHKNWKHLLHFALFLALICFAFSPDVARTLFPRTMLVLGQGSTQLVWPR